MELTRTNADTGKVHTVTVASLRDARKHVAWCGTDNMNMARKDASRAAEDLHLGESYTLGVYVFTWS